MFPPVPRMTEPPMSLSAPELKSILQTVTAGSALSAAEAESVFDHIISGEATPVWMASFLTALQTRGVVAEEVAGGVRALRKAMIPVPSREGAPLIDTCGTGGGTVTTFNISTAAALVAAGAGARLAKHGNRSFTSRSGSADVLEALGVGIELTPERMGQVLDEVGIVFMFAPLLHPAMRHVGPVRRELGIRTVMNLLGPLTNPAGVKRQVVGVSDPDLLPLIAGALRELGHERALVAHGEPGMDEISPLGTTLIHELRDGELQEYEIRPEALGLELHTPSGLEGGEPEDNAARVLAVLSGEARGVARSAVLLNAGAALYVADIAASLFDGVAAAAAAVDDGRAMAKLDALREATVGSV